MSMWEVSLRTQYDYPFIRMSGEYPGVPISMWCIWNRELVRVPSQDAAALKGIERGIRGAGRIVDRWIDSKDARLFLLRCTCGDLDSPWNVWEAHDFRDAPPAVYKDGWGYFRLLTFDEGGTRPLFRDFNKRGPTELLGKKEISLQVLPTSVWVSSLFADLTQKQIDAVLKAQRHGYYTTPRKATTENIADAVGVSRSTYEEHLRKAENRIMEALIPYLQLYSEGEKLPEKLPSRGTALEAAVVAG